MDWLNDIVANAKKQVLTGEAGKGMAELEAMATVAPEKTNVLKEFGKSALGSTLQMGQMAGGLAKVAGDITGIEPLQRAGEDAIGYWGEKAAPYAPRIGSIADVESVGDFADYAAAGIGGLVPTVAVSLLGGGIGGALGKAAVGSTIAAAEKAAAGEVLAPVFRAGAGAVLRKKAADEVVNKAVTKAVTRGAMAGAGTTSAGMEIGSIGADQVEAGTTDPLKAILYGSVAGALDILPVTNLLAKFPAFKSLQQIPLFKSPEGRSWYTRGVMEGFKQAGMEGAQESAQTMLERAGASREVFSDEGLMEMLNAGIIGAMGGGVMGGGAGVLSGSGKKQAPAIEENIESQSANLKPAAIGSDPLADDTAPPHAVEQYEQQEQQVLPEENRVAVENSQISSTEQKPVLTRAVGMIPSTGVISEDINASTAQSVLANPANTTDELVLDEARDWAVEEIKAGKTQLMQQTGEPASNYAQRILGAFKGRSDTPVLNQNTAGPKYANVSLVNPETGLAEMVTPDEIMDRLHKGWRAPEATAPVKVSDTDILGSVTDDDRGQLQAARERAAYWERGSMNNGRSNKTELFPWLKDWGKTTPKEVEQAIGRFLEGKQLGDIQQQLVAASIKWERENPAPAVDASVNLSEQKPGQKTNSALRKKAETYAEKTGVSLDGFSEKDVADFVKKYDAWRFAERQKQHIKQKLGRTKEPKARERLQKALEKVQERQGTIDAGAHEAATSPRNDLAEPTEAQVKAGNYRKGHVSIQGLDISIENPAGSVRSGKDSNGKPWSTTIHHHYGYIKGTVGKDKDHIDTFIGDKPEGDRVFVVDQIDPKTGAFDEHKVMIGFDSQDQATLGYLRNYDDTGQTRIGAVTGMSMDDFKTWLKSGNTKKPVGNLKGVSDGKAAAPGSGTVSGKTGTASTDNRAETAETVPPVRGVDGLLGGGMSVVQPSNDARGKIVEKLKAHVDEDTAGKIADLIAEEYAGKKAFGPAWLGKRIKEGWVSKWKLQAQLKSGEKNAEDLTPEEIATLPVAKEDRPVNATLKAVMKGAERDSQQGKTAEKEKAEVGEGSGQRTADSEQQIAPVKEVRNQERFKEAQRKHLRKKLAEARTETEKERYAKLLEKLKSRNEQADSSIDIDNEIQTLSLEDLSNMFDEVVSEVQAEQAPLVDEKASRAAKFKRVRREHIKRKLVEAKEPKERERLKKALDKLNARKAVVAGEVDQTKPEKDNAKEPFFKKGQRVQLSDGNHGEISEVTSYVMRSALLDITRHGGVGVTEQKEETNHMYNIRKDNGVVVHAHFQDIFTETDPAPVIVPAPVFENSPVDPANLLTSIQNDKNAARSNRASASRARKKENITELQRAADRYEKSAAEKQTVFDQWAAQHPNEAVKYQPETETASDAPVSTGSTRMSLKETIHSKKGHKLFVVVMNERVERDEYDRMNRDAKRTGNGYSSYRGHGAIPGFQFLEKGAAEEFMQRWGGIKEKEEQTLTTNQQKTIRDLGPVGTKVQFANAMNKEVMTITDIEPEYGKVAVNGDKIYRWSNDFNHASESTEAGQQANRTASDILKEAASQGIEGVGEAVTGLYELFGGASLKSFPGGIDESTYAKAKPHFQAAFEKFRAAGKGVKDFFRFLIEQFGPGIKPYSMRFIAELQGGSFDEAKPALTDTTQSDNIANEDTSINKEGADRDDSGNGGNGPRALEGVLSGDLSGDGETQRPGKGIRSSGEADTARDDDTDEGGSDGTGGMGSVEIPVHLQRPVEGLQPGLEHVPTPASEPRTLTLSGENPGNYRITESDRIGEGTRGERINNNLAAIRIAKQLQEEGRYASREEQATLARYVGWGGLKSVFDPTSSKPQDQKARTELESLLTKEEYFEARQSVLNAHYTSREVIGAIYDVARHFGFTGGNVLEPTYGVGNFIGLMPGELAASSKWYGAELDPITAVIGKHLYPESQLLNVGFQQAEFPYNKFDLAIGNPPFGDERITDTNKRRAEIDGMKIHNYVIAKAGMHLKPGKLMAMVVTSRFLDTANPEARSHLAKDFSFLGAIRLPNNAFAKSAGTDVVTDLVFFRKLMPDEKPDFSADWLTTGATMTNEQGEEVRLNKYFADRPGMMLGIPSMQGSMYGGGARGDQFTLTARDDQDTQGLIKEILSGEFASLKDVLTERANDQADAAAVSIEMNREDVGVGGYVTEGSDIFMREDDDADGNPVFTKLTADTQWTEKTKLGKTRLERIRGMMQLREETYKLIEMERFDQPGIERQRSHLNRLYDTFVKEHGFINNSANAGLMADDVKIEFGLEVNYRKPVSVSRAKAMGGKAQGAKADKASLLRERVFYPQKEITTAANVRDGYGISLSEKGLLDLDYIAGLTGKEKSEVISELADEGLIFQDPETSEWVQEDEYLSGNVKAKLKSVQHREGYERNAAELKKVQPKDVATDDIFADIGATWIPAKVYEDFADMMGIIKAKVHVSEATGTVTIVDSGNIHQNDMNVMLKNDDYDMTQLFNFIANKRAVVAYDHDSEGKRFVNKERTKVLVPIVKRFTATFRDWIMADPMRAQELTKLYNDTQNTHAERVFDGKHLKTVGANPAIIMRNTQRNAAWRMIQAPVTLLDHVVGSGKTFTIITGIMERRRLGLSRKPMVVVPNHLVGQWAKDFLRLYPGANILAATEKDFSKPNRRRLFSRIATGNFDAVIVGHSSFGFIPMERETEIRFVQEEMEYLERALSDAQSAEDKRTVRTLTNRIAKKRERIARLQNRDRDNVATFESMGVDHLTVDESHEFKNLEYSTSMQNVTGMGSPTGAKKSFDLYAKIRYLRSKEGAVTFATGTPISNSLVEMYTLLRYLNLEGLKERRLDAFDAWAKSYAGIETRIEYTATQKLKERGVMADFNNLPELLQLYTEFADIVSMSDLKRIYAEQIRESNRATGATEREEFPVPKVKDGGRVLDVADPLYSQREFMDYLVARATRLERLGGQNDPKTDNHLWVMNDARKMALDIRLVDPSAPADPNNKIGRSAKNIKRIYDKWNADKGTQLVFCDLSTPAKQSDKDAKKFIKDALKALMLEKDSRVQSVLDSLSWREQWAYLKNRMETKVEELNNSLQNNPNLSDADEKSLNNWMNDLEKYLEDVGDENEAALTTADTGFSVYDDLKSALVEMGIPENEIRFIHEANTKDQKEELFGMVNSGEVRVLFGSSKKMGAGTNVQERVVALHHLDAPWRPSDVEQREGRAVRQGNSLYERDPEGFELELIAYSTGNTFDAVMWQVLARKAEMLEQFRSGARSVQEGQSDSDSYATFMAESTGNPAFKEKFRLESEIEELEGTQRNIQARRSAAERLVGQKDKLTSKATLSIERAAADIEAAADADGFIYEGVTFAEDLDEAQAAARAEYKTAWAEYEKALNDFNALKQGYWLTVNEQVGKGLDEEVAKAQLAKWDEDHKDEKPIAPKEVSLAGLARVSEAAKLGRLIEKRLDEMEEGELVVKYGGVELTFSVDEARWGNSSLKKGERKTYDYTIAVGNYVGTYQAKHPAAKEIIGALKDGAIKRQLVKEHESAKQQASATSKSIADAERILDKVKFSDAALLEEKRKRYTEVVEEVNRLEAEMETRRENESNPYIDRDSRRFGSYDRRSVATQTQDNPDVRYSLSPEADLNREFNDDIDKLSDNKLTMHHIFHLGSPSKILTDAGIPDLPIRMKLSTVRKVTGLDGKGKHDLTTELLYNLPRHINNPVAVFSSDTQAGAKTLLLQFKHNGKPVMAALHLEERLGNLEVNEIASIYEREEGNYVNWVVKGRLVSLDKAKGQWLLERVRRAIRPQTSGSLTPNKILYHRADEVKSGIREDAPRYSAGAAMASFGLPAADIETAFEPVYKNMPNSPPWRVVQTAAELPKRALNDAAKRKIPQRLLQAVYLGDEVVYVADNFRSIEEAKQVLLEETVVHHGLRGIMAKDTYEKHMLQAALWYANKRNAEWKELAGQYGLDLKTREGRIEAAEEMLGRDARTGMDSTMLSRVIAAVKEYLRSIGFDVKYGDAEIRELLGKARRFVEGKEQGAGDKGQGTGIDYGALLRSLREQGITDDQLEAFATWQPGGARFAFSPNQYKAFDQDTVTGYENVFDSLMGFGKDPKGYGETKYPFELDVFYSFDGETWHDDVIKGMNPLHAFERARRNWAGATIKTLPIDSKFALARLEDVKGQIVDKGVSLNTTEREVLEADKAKALEAIETTVRDYDEPGRYLFRAFYKADQEQSPGVVPYNPERGHYAAGENLKGSWWTTSYATAQEIAWSKARDGRPVKIVALPVEKLPAGRVFIQNTNPPGFVYDLFVGLPADVSMADVREMPVDTGIRYALADRFTGYIGEMKGGDVWKKIARMLNPFDWSRFKRTIIDITPQSIMNGAASFLRNPVFEAEADENKKPFVENGIKREQTKLDYLLRFLGWDGQSADNPDIMERLKKTYSQWESGDRTTEWGRITDGYQKLSAADRKGVDWLLYQGDMQGRVFPDMETAVKDPRVAKGKPTEAAFAMYQKVRNHIDTVVADTVEDISRNFMLDAGLPDQVIEKHLSDYRNRLAERPGWLPRNHGEGDYQVNVYHHITGLKWQTRGDKDSMQALLPYYPSKEVADEIKKIATRMGLKYQHLPKGGQLVSTYKNATAVFKKKIDKLQSKINAAAADEKSKLQQEMDELKHAKMMAERMPSEQINLFWKKANEIIPNLQTKNKLAIHERKEALKQAIEDGESESTINMLKDELKKFGDGSIRVKVYMRLKETKTRAEQHKAEVEKDLKKYMPGNYLDWAKYEVEERFSDQLSEDMYGDMKNDFAMEQGQLAAINKAAAHQEISKKEAAALRQTILQSTAEVLMARGAGAHRIRRAEYLIEGYDAENTVDAYHDYMTGTSGMLSKARYAQEQFEQFRYAKPEVKRWAHKYIVDNLRNMGFADRVSGNMRALASFAYLGFKVSSMLINATQPWTLGIAELGRHTKRSAVWAIGKAQKDILSGKLSESEKRLFASEIFRLQEMETSVHEMSGQREGVTGKVSRFMHTLTDKALMPFQEVELLNRKTVILAAYRTFRADGISRNEALQKALEVNRSVNFEMSRANLPGFAQKPLGRTVYALQSFMWNTWNWVFNRMTSGEKEDMKALLRYAVSTAIIGGAMALPGGDELDKLYQMFFGESPKLAFRKWTAKHAKEYGSLGEMLNGFAWHGAASAAGVNISNAIRLQIPIVSPLIGGESLPDAAGGVMTGLMQKGSRAAVAASRGDIYRTMENLSPEALAGAMRAYRMSTKGATTTSGKVLFDENGRPMKYSGGEAITRALGFQPSRVSERSALTNIEYGLTAHWKEERSDLLAKLRMAQGAERKEVMLKIMKFNRKLRESQAAGLVPIIKAQTIKQALAAKPNKRKMAWEQEQLT